MTPTKEQAQAIGQRGEVLVSASAGSGKTAVMIERLVSLVLGGADVGQVLAVTFTKKAAAQMRERLRTALLERISKGNTALQSQLDRLPLADISTIHAFCARLVRSNFFLAGVEPSFRIVSPDDAEGKTLSRRALEETFEEAYAKKEEEFYELLAVYFRRKKDTRLKAIVLSLHSAVCGLADYRSVLASAGEDTFPAAAECLFADFRERVCFLLEGVEERGPFFAEHNLRALAVAEDILKTCRTLLGAEDLFAMAALSSPPQITVMPRMTKATGQELAHLRFLSSASKEIKEICKELRELGTREEEAALAKDALSRAKALARLTLAYDEKYTDKKREAGVLDYNDLEHLALRVLENEEARKDALEHYKYIFVDEYQDVNPIQEQILSRLSGGELFLVGDGKQAIYGFRGSRSGYFDEKRASFQGHGGALALTENFRSAEAVLEAVNLVFSPILPAYEPMHGGARYQKDGKRYFGEVCFHHVLKGEKEEKTRGVYSVLEADPEEKTDELAESVASLVEREVSSGKTWFDADEGSEKKVTFGDIAVLVRKNTGDMERIVRALSQRGIPVSAGAKVNVCDFFEARLLIDWFSYLDNAMQDIPLASAMLSAVGGFTESELSRIRLRFPSPYTFRESAESYRDKMADPLSRKLKDFFSMCESLRRQSRVKTATEMAGLLLSMGLEAQIAAKREGAMRLARVRRLISESEGKGSVHDFLSSLAASDYEVEYAAGGGENAVKVLTMHASKGLEFPVVLLAGLDAPFHGADRDEVMWTERFLLAPKSFDMSRGVVRENVLRRASAVVQEREELVGERNLLYVAMTRARYRLHLFFGEKDPVLSPAYAHRFSDFFDLPRLASYFTEEEEAAPPIPRSALAREGSGERKEEILRAYGKAYPFASSIGLPVKSSATQLLKEERAEGEREIAASGHSTEEGLAYHAFLEHVRFGENAEEELARMGAQGLLSKEQLALLDKEKLRAILSIPCLSGLRGKRLLREQTFLALLPACEVMETDAEDEIVFQGAIDLLVEDEEGYTVVDYKFSGKSDEALRTHYRPQIELYKRAVARAKGVALSTVRARIVNIAACREIQM